MIGKKAILSVLNGNSLTSDKIKGILSRFEEERERLINLTFIWGDDDVFIEVIPK